MPIPPLLIPPLISAGAGLISDFVGSISQSEANRKTREWQEKMYARQRTDALADWNMQNQYNSPQEQMKRLKAAGLNPNLVYGTGAVGNASTQIRSSSPGSYTAKAYQPNFGATAINSIASYYDTQVKSAQVDNLKKNNELLQQEKLKKAAETLNIIQSTKKGQFEYDLANELRDITIASARQGLEKTAAETQLTLTEREIKELMAKPSLEKILQEIVNLKAEALLKSQQYGTGILNQEKIRQETQLLKQQISNMATEGQLKQFELDLKRQRGSASDWPGFMKVVFDAFKFVTGAVQESNPDNYPKGKLYDNEIRR